MLFFAIALLFSGRIAFATHNRAGELTLTQISGLTYEIKITTFTYSLSPAKRSELEVQWGDNTTSIAPIIPPILSLPNYYLKNTYITRHTYPGPGTYQVVVQDPNRNLGVKNIPNSVNVIFSVKTTISINSGIGENSTPILLNYPIDKAALGRTFIHNPAAFDPDGDSLSYSLAICSKENGEPIENYTFPKASDSLFVNPLTGDLVWKTPVEIGVYNIAMNISEWRNGVKIGNIVRDMQIDVFESNNHPPVIDSLGLICILGGNKLTYEFEVTDEDNDTINVGLTGGPFALGDSLTTYEIISSQPGKVRIRFTWQTDCRHPRLQPYNLVVKAEDQNNELNLIDIKTLFIKVLAPSPENLQIVPSSNSATVLWDPYECNIIRGYNIYRREGTSMIALDSCEGGMPGNSGFVLAGTVKSHSVINFRDDNNGNGLIQGINYCYRITAIYPDGSESFPSEQICTTLIPGTPSLLNASVTNASENGSVFLSWIKPVALDTIPANGPYEYLIYRSGDLWGRNLIQIGSFTTTDLNDTTYTDQGLNTLLYPYSYSVELYNNAPGNRFKIGESEVASTFYPLVEAADNSLKLTFVRNVPWFNTEYTIYRSSTINPDFDSIGSTTDDFYMDNNLINETQYCYLIRSRGYREKEGTIFLNENLSHINCGTPGDIIPPCPPQFIAITECDLKYNDLNWYYPAEDAECSEDVYQYYIYYKPTLDLDYQVIDSLKGRENNSYRHYPAAGLAGCYYVTAIDSFGNESIPSMSICLDNCSKYEIPNVFSPNNDQINDILKPYAYQDVEKIDLKIFNRWGQLVFETEDPDINWDGKFMNTNELVSPGVYYYICGVYEQRITGVEVRNLVGFIHIFHEKGASNEIPNTDF